ncbi:MAG: AsmA family protein [Burkholderiales bacterium]|nr:AsmA family protein [Burkholderiales bacterium]
MKILKYLFVVIGALVVLVGGLLAYVAATFDPNAYKPQIIQLVQERTQRTLKLEGDIKLAFWPGIGAELGRLSLSERNSASVFAAVEGARLSLKLMPLLSKRLVVDEIAIKGARINLVRYQDGRLSVDDLAARDDGRAPAKQVEAPQEAFAFDISQVVIADSALSFRDEAGKAQYAISKLNLKTGRLANGVPADVVLSLVAQASQPRLNLTVDATTRLTFDLGRQSYALQNLALEVRGQAADVSNLALKAAGGVTANLQSGEFAADKLTVAATGLRGKDTFDVKIDAPRLNFSGGQAAGEKLTVTAKLGGPAGATSINLVLPGIAGSMQAFKSAALTLDIDIKQGDQTVKAKLVSPLSGNLQARQFSLPRLQATMAASGPRLPGKSISGQLAGAASFDITKENAQLDVAGKVADSTLKARIGVTGFSPPGIDFDVEIDQLNVDKFLPPAATAGGGPAAPAPAAAAPEKPFDLSGLKALRANGSLRIGALQVNNLKAANVRADLKAGNGRIDVNPLAANLYQGTLQGAASVNAAPALPAFALKASLAGIQVAPLLKDLANNETLEGRGTVVLDVTTHGNTVTALKRALHGTGSLRLVDGAVKGIDIAGAIRNAKARLGALKGEQTQQADARQKTDFSELTATFNIANGIARNRDLSMKSPLLRVGGEGEINIGADTINYLVKASVVGTSKGQGGRDTDDLRGITVPVRVSGPFKAPSYKLDFGAMITDTARQKVEDAVKERLLERLGGGAKPGGEATPKEGAKSGGSARDALKGLFGR